MAAPARAGAGREGAKQEGGVGGGAWSDQKVKEPKRPRGASFCRMAEHQEKSRELRVPARVAGRFG